MRRLTITLLALLVAACERPVPEVVEVVRPIKMLELSAGGAGQTLLYPATIGAAREAEIAFEVGGLITELPVLQGQFVREGQLLARLDPRDFEANLDAVRAQRNAALADYRRNQDLYAADAVSQQQLDVSRRQFEVVDARIRTVEKALDDSTLVAPFSGSVARTFVEAFQSIGPREPILVLQDVASSLEVVLNVPENDVAFRPDASMSEVQEGLVLEVELTSYPGQRFPARFLEYSSEADPIARTFEVTLAFTPPSEVRVLPGMTARVYVSRAGRAVEFQIPANALVGDVGGDPFVWVVDRSSMTVTRRAVELGDLAADSVAIVGGLNGGETIATSAAQNLREGMEVREIQQN